MFKRYVIQVSAEQTEADESAILDQDLFLALMSMIQYDDDNNTGRKYTNQGAHVIHTGIGAPSSASICGFSTINSAKSRSRPRLGKNKAVLKSFEVVNANCTVTNDNIPTGHGSRLGVCHVETLTVFLQPDERTGYGLLVNTDGVDQQQANIIITHLNHDSSAYSSKKFELHTEQDDRTNTANYTEPAKLREETVENITKSQEKYKDQYDKRHHANTHYTIGEITLTEIGADQKRLCATTAHVSQLKCRTRIKRVNKKANQARIKRLINSRLPRLRRVAKKKVPWKNRGLSALLRTDYKL
ncbi:hypothetical protein CBL_05170 [Carabus blaptoides fortunei]